MCVSASTVRIIILVSLLAAWASSACVLFAQTTVATGSIVGVVSDPTGAFINEAHVKCTDVATGQAIGVATNSTGSFDSGALIPSYYKVVVSARGFSSAESEVPVLVGNTATLNVRLQVGREKVSESCIAFGKSRNTVFGS
jgi:carboxypeptidase family protein